jgi:hypothetical protein
VRPARPGGGSRRRPGSAGRRVMRLTTLSPGCPWRVDDHLRPVEVGSRSMPSSVRAAPSSGRVARTTRPGRRVVAYRRCRSAWPAFAPQGRTRPLHPDLTRFRCGATGAGGAPDEEQSAVGLVSIVIGSDGNARIQPNRDATGANFARGGACRASREASDGLGSANAAVPAHLGAILAFGPRASRS